MKSLINTDNYFKIRTELEGRAILVAVSKKQAAEKVSQLIELGHHVFGENYVQELAGRNELFGNKSLKWHMIGHLQSNKVKMIAPFVSLIQGVDSFELLKIINKEAIKCDRIIDCLIQVHIAEEESKFGFDSLEISKMLENPEFEALKNVRIRGLMGMATFTEDCNLVRKEFSALRKQYEKIKSEANSTNMQIDILSMGMSDDYKIAIDEGSTMVRIGTLIFGGRNF